MTTALLLGIGALGIVFFLFSPRWLDRGPMR
jgi:hypothetical protein